MTRAPAAKFVVLAAALLAAGLGGTASAAQQSVAVGLSVTFIPTSGACGVAAAQAGFELVCGRPVVVSGGGGSPHAGYFPGAQGRGSVFGPGPGPVGADGQAGGGRGDQKPGEGDTEGEFLQRFTGTDGLHDRASAEITSWRLVSYHNGAYVELTIAW